MWCFSDSLDGIEIQQNCIHSYDVVDNLGVNREGYKIEKRSSSIE